MTEQIDHTLHKRNQAANRFAELSHERRVLTRSHRKALAEMEGGIDMTRTLFEQQVEAREMREEANEALNEWLRLGGAQPMEEPVNFD
jgi:uncharacterized coiled-coil DUF342 family protein